MIDAVQVSLPPLEVCLPGDGVDFHRCQFMAKKGGYSYELPNIAAGEVFSVICHFVQFLGAARSFRHGAERFLQYGQNTRFFQVILPDPPLCFSPQVFLKGSLNFIDSVPVQRDEEHGNLVTFIDGAMHRAR